MLLTETAQLTKKPELEAQPNQPTPVYLAESFFQNVGQARLGALDAASQLFQDDRPQALAVTLEILRQPIHFNDGFNVDTNGPTADSDWQIRRGLTQLLQKCSPDELQEIAPVLFSNQPTEDNVEDSASVVFSDFYSIFATGDSPFSHAGLDMKRACFFKVAHHQAIDGHPEALQTVKSLMGDKATFVLTSDNRMLHYVSEIESLKTTHQESPQDLATEIIHFYGSTIDALEAVSTLDLNDQQKIAVLEACLPEVTQGYSILGPQYEDINHRIEITQTLTTPEVIDTSLNQLFLTTQGHIDHLLQNSSELTGQSDTIRNYISAIDCFLENAPKIIAHYPDSNLRQQFVEKYLRFKESNATFISAFTSESNYRHEDQTAIATLIRHVPPEQQLSMLERLESLANTDIGTDPEQIAQLYQLAETCFRPKVYQNDEGHTVENYVAEIRRRHLELISRSLEGALLGLGDAKTAIDQKTVARWLSFTFTRDPNIPIYRVRDIRDAATSLIPCISDLDGKGKADFIQQQIADRLVMRPTGRKDETDFESPDTLLITATKLEEVAKTSLLINIRSEIPKMAGSEGMAELIASVKDDKLKIVFFQDYIHEYIHQRKFSLQSLSSSKISLILSSFQNQDIYAQAVGYLDKSLHEPVKVPLREFRRNFFHRTTFGGYIKNGGAVPVWERLGTHFAEAVINGTIASVGARHCGRTEFAQSLQLAQKMHRGYHGQPQSYHRDENSWGGQLGLRDGSPYPVGYVTGDQQFEHEVARGVGAISFKQKQFGLISQAS